MPRVGLVRQSAVSSMKSFANLAAGALTRAWPAIMPAMAQTPELQNSQIDIAYLEPSNSDYRAIYDRLKKRRVLEELREFLAPLRLPRKVLAKTEQCDQPSRPFT